MQFDKLLRETSRPLRVAMAPAIVNKKVTADGPPELLEALPKNCEASLRFEVAFGIARQHADAPYPIGLLRPRRERPHRRPPSSVMNSRRLMCGWPPPGKR